MRRGSSGSGSARGFSRDRSAAADGRSRACRSGSAAGAGQRRPSRDGAPSSPSYATPELWTKDGGRSGRRGASSARPAALRQPSARSGRSGGARQAAGAAASVAGGALAGLFGLIARSRIAVAVCILLVVLGAGFLIDFGVNFGRAYAGVSIGGVDVSGKTADEIVQLLDDEYQTRIDSAQVLVYASEQARDEVDAAAAQAQDAALAEQLSLEDARANRQLWTVDAASVAAAVSAEDLAAQALAVGREDGGLLARIAALFAGAPLEVELSYDENLLESLAEEIDAAIGNPRVDYGIAVQNGVASVTEGHDGMMVDRGWFRQQLDAAFLSSGNPSFVAEVSYAPLRIDQAAAQAVCDQVNEAIAGGAQLSYGGATWEMGSVELGACVRADVQEAGEGYQLVPSLDAATTQPLIFSDALKNVEGLSVRVSFEPDGAGSFTVSTSGSGEVPLAAEATSALSAVLFGGQETADVAPLEGHAADAGSTHAQRGQAGEPAQVQLVGAPAPEQMTFDEAVQSGIVAPISSFTTEFSTGAGTENRNHNIQLAASLLDGSIVKPDGTWSFNETAGNCNEEAGFLGAGSIVDGEYTDEVGGGICQVATTVFNAVYESGLPVYSRTNHSLYIASYPAGRDAAVSWPYLDLQWGNDTESDILVSMATTDSTVTCTLYGVSPGYLVTTEVGEWEEGEKYETEEEVDETLAPGTSYVKTAGSDGSKISVVRTVTDSDGNIVRADRFDSVYDPIDEIIVKGPDDGSKDEGEGEAAEGGSDGASDGTVSQDSTQSQQ
ncbi:MAG TPA: VanW family protein [Candidatus Aphodovivens avistercoris]|nr:VanW family protein [Candidatus Aphodovivens avistercoris]